MSWVTDIMSLTYTSEGDINGCILSIQLTGETAEISKFLDFCFYDYVSYIDNADLGPKLPGRWLGVTPYQGNLMYYHILNQKW